MILYKARLEKLESDINKLRIKNALLEKVIFSQNLNFLIFLMF